jgi:N-acetylmuramoyl-L-alanine amidase
VFKINLQIIFILLAFGFCNLSFLFCQNRLDVVVIDAGHGGKDPGTIGDKTGVQEKNIVLPVSIKFGTYIEQKYPAIRVIYTRTTDEFIELRDRTKIANDNRAKLFISIHANHKKLEESQKNGFEIYLLKPESLEEAVLVTMKENIQLSYRQPGADTIDNFIFSSLAQSGYYRLNEILASNIEIKMVNTTQLASRGVFQADYLVIRRSSMPCVLVETGYLSDINDERYLSSEIGQNEVALALFQAFQNYKIIYEAQ